MATSPDDSSTALLHEQTSQLSHLHTILLRRSRLTGHQQLALHITVLHLLDMQLPCIAAHVIISIAGSCTPASVQLQQELTELASHTHLLHQLTRLLALNWNSYHSISSSSSTSCSSQCLHPNRCPSAALPILSCCKALAAIAQDCQLLDWWQEEATQSALLKCACTSMGAADLVASLASAVACKGLPAKLLLQQLVLPSASLRHGRAAGADDGPSITAGTWVALGLPPMLLHLLLQLQQQQQQRSPLTGNPIIPSSEEQLWLLLCSCIDAANAATGLVPLQTLQELCSSDVFVSCLQAGLLAVQQPQLHAAIVQMVVQLSGLSGQLAAVCFRAMAPIMLQLMPLLMCEQRCHHGTGTAASSGVPIASSDPPEAQRMLQTWQYVLNRTCSSDSRQCVVAWVGEQLPSITATLATAAVTASSPVGPGKGSATTTTASHESTCQQPLEAWPAGTGHTSSALDTYLAVFLPAAGSIACHTQPLLVNHQPSLIAAVAPHKAAMLQLISSYAVAVTTLQGCSDNSTSHMHGGSESASGRTCNSQAALLAVWLLHSLVAVEQLQGCAARQQLQRQQHSASTSPKIINYAESSSSAADRASCAGESWAGTVEAIARWLVIENPTSVQVQLQAAGLVLAKLLLAVTAQDHEVEQRSAAAEVRWPRCNASTDAKQELRWTGVGKGFNCQGALVTVQQEPEVQWEWQQLLAALERVLAGGATGDCRTVRRRQLLRIACEVVHRLAQRHPHLLLADVRAEVQNITNSRSCGSCSSSADGSGTASSGWSSQGQAHELKSAMAGLGWTTVSMAVQRLDLGDRHQVEQPQLLFCCRLSDHLQQLHLRLLQLKLCRSCSGQELLDAVDEAIEGLQAMQHAALHQ